MNTNSVQQWRLKYRLSELEAAAELQISLKELNLLDSTDLPLPVETEQRLQARIAIRLPTAGPAIVRQSQAIFSAVGKFDAKPNEREFATNDLALNHACQLLSETTDSQFRIVTKSGESLWSPVALRAECDRRKRP